MNREKNMKTTFILLTITISLIIIPLHLSEPSFNGSAPGCAGSGCHSFSDGDVSITILDSVNIQVTVGGTTSSVGGELMDGSGNVVDVVNSTNSNPFILTAPGAGDYVINAGYKNPSRDWDSAAISLIIPVELASFSASVTEDDVTLKWQTATELNNSGFQVERMQENEDWSEIGFVNGNGTTTEIHNYTFKDKDLSAGIYFYRIKQIDFNGTYEYFNLEEEIEIALPDKFTLLQNYPNPFNPVTTIKFSLQERTNVVLTVFNSIGEDVITLVNDERPAGIYEVKFNATGFTSGIYYYKLITNDFIQTKKMIILK
jgi:hypothetical protein